MADDSAAATAGPVDISDIKGVPRGGALGPGRFLFRGQLFWQELLPEHVATTQLEFRIGMGEDSRKVARIPGAECGVPGSELLPDDHPLLIQAAVCVPGGREDEAEVAAAIRAVSSWGDRKRLRRLLASCFVTRSACGPALCEAAGKGHEDIVEELLRAGASPSSCDIMPPSSRAGEPHALAGPGGKTALHFACEQGQEGVARLLLAGRADLCAVDATGRTACDLAREQDLGMLAKRLEREFLPE